MLELRTAEKVARKVLHNIHPAPDKVYSAVVAAESRDELHMAEVGAMAVIPPSESTASTEMESRGTVDTVVETVKAAGMVVGAMVGASTEADVREVAVDSSASHRVLKGEIQEAVTWVEMKAEEGGEEV